MALFRQFISVGLMTTLCQMSFANTLNTDLTTTVNELPLSSVSLLQSLRAPTAAQHIKVPVVEELYTAQNVRTLFSQTNHLPMVDIQLTFNAGSARDESIEKGLFGLAHLTAQLLNQGTATQNTAEIAEAFAKVGAQYSAQAQRDMLVIKLRVRSDERYLQPALHQLIEVLTQANFPQDSIDRLFNNVSIGQKQIQENPSRSMGVRFYRSVYDKHPYAEPPTGTVGSLKKIKPEHLQAFHQRYLVNNNLNLAITGDVNPQQVEQIANQITAQLPLGERAPQLIDAKSLTKAEVIVLPFNSSQAHVMIGQIGLKRHDPDRLAMEVGNEILGGSGFTSLLMQNLREKHGFTYGVSSSLSSLQSNGLLSLSYATRQDQLLASIAEAYQTLFDFIEQPLDQQLVEMTKKSMLRSYPQYFSNNANLNSQLGAMGFYGLPTTHLSNYAPDLQKLTAEDIQRVWRKYLQPERLLTVIAGKDVTVADVMQIYQKKSQTITP